MLSNEHYKPTANVTKEVNQIGVKELLKVDESWLDAGLKEFETNAGNITEFATELIGGKTALIRYLEYCEK
jgi:hypothetical protein